MTEKGAPSIGEGAASMSVLIRADASREIGGGHVYRCLALADALESLGARCTFLTAAESPETVPALAASQHRKVILDGPTSGQDGSALRSVSRGSDLLIVDHYALSEEFERACRPWTGAVVAIDDAPNRSHDVDMLIDLTPGRTVEDYAQVAPGACILTGSSYALIRPQFADARPTALVSRRKRNGDLERVLMMFGATDPLDCTSLSVAELLRVPKVSIDVVLGLPPVAGSEILTLLEAHPDRLRVHVAPPNLPDLMRQADLAVGAGGGSTWEWCTMGLPSVVVQLAPNQRDVVRALVGAEAAIGIGEGPDALAGALAPTVAELASDPARLVQMSESAAGVCDGLGARRVATTLARCFA